MLVLTRKLQQQIKIGNEITVTILRVKGQTVRVGIEAPRTMRVVRGELTPKSAAALAEEGAAADALHDDVPEVEELAFVITGDDFSLESEQQAAEEQASPEFVAASAAANGFAAVTSKTKESGPSRKASSGNGTVDHPTKAPRLPQRKRFNRTDNPPLRVAMQSLSTAMAK
jgi:carbon storage regulator CsrA